jgi:hypothetical protein
MQAQGHVVAHLQPFQIINSWKKKGLRKGSCIPKIKVKHKIIWKGLVTNETQYEHKGVDCSINIRKKRVWTLKKHKD